MLASRKYGRLSWDLSCKIFVVSGVCNRNTAGSKIAVEGIERYSESMSRSKLAKLGMHGKATTRTRGRAGYNRRGTMRRYTLGQYNVHCISQLPT
ncbi:hypothetical protein VTO73DRAFT_14426 [Trametes versicolor]